MKFIKKAAIFILITTILLWGSVAIAAAEHQTVGPEQFEGKKIGVVGTSNYVDNVYRMFENPDVRYYPYVYDLILALSVGKVDAIAVNEAVIRYNLQTNPEMAYFAVDDECRETTALILANTNRGRKYQREFNFFLKQLQKEGKLEELQKKWFDGEGNQEMPDYTTLPATNGVITVATNPTYAPFEFVSKGKIVGYEIELMARFCQKCGYGMDLKNVEYDGVVAGVVADEFDIGLAGCNITEGENEHLLFSDPVYDCPLTAAYLTDSKVNTDRFAGKKVAVEANSYYVDYVYDVIKSPEVSYFLDPAEMFDAVAAGKMDCCLSDDINGEYHLSQYDDLTFMDLNDYADVGFAASKTTRGKALTEEFNEFMEALREDGKLNDLQDKWLRGSESDRKMSIDYRGLKGKNGSVTFAVFANYPPFEYEKNGELVGYEVELAALFCKEKGYRPVFKNVELHDILSGVAENKYDFGIATLGITEERAESVYFSNSIYESTSYIIYREDKTDQSIFLTMKSRLKKTFMTNNRLNLFYRGILVTIVVSFTSIFVGLVLGFLIYLVYRKDKKAMKHLDRIMIKVFNVVKWVVQGMPEVVLLMIMFYVLFAQTDLSAATVAIIGFSLIFTCSFLSLLQAGEDGVDEGQILGARSLGYSESKTFFKIILPQAAYGFLPSLENEMVSLIKATAVVGYISVVDITKVADIIRGSTYDALFPLIAVAIIYVILTNTVRLVIRSIRNRINPRNRTEAMITKGFVIK